MNLSKNAKPASLVLSNAMSLICYIYGTDLSNLEELHVVGAEQELTESMEVLLCDSSYNTNRQSELKSSGLDKF